MINETIGQISALTSAASWAFATILWYKLGDRLSYFSLNLFKTVFGSLYLVVFVLIAGIYLPSFNDTVFLIISGLIGIALGDTFYFKSLTYIGPRLSALMGTVVPVCTTILAIFILGEKVSSAALMGILMTVGGVAWVVTERVTKKDIIKNKSMGVKYALISVLCTSLGTVFAKIGIKTTPALHATLIRMIGAGLGLMIWGYANNQLKNWINPFIKNKELFRKSAFAVFVSVFGGFVLFNLSNECSTG